MIAACKQLSRSVQGIFGPSDPLLGAHIQSICEALDVPHLEARVDFEPTFKEFSINLYPAPDHLNKAFKDLMSFLNWTRVAIIYEEDYGKWRTITCTFEKNFRCRENSLNPSELRICRYVYSMHLNKSIRFNFLLISAIFFKSEYLYI